MNENNPYSDKVRRALELNKLKKEGLPEITEMEKKVRELEDVRRALNGKIESLRTPEYNQHADSIILTQEEFDSDTYKIDTFFGRSLKVEHMLTSFVVFDTEEEKKGAIERVAIIRTQIHELDEKKTTINRSIQELHENIQVAKSTFRRAIALEEELMEFNVPEDQKELLKAVMTLVDKRVIPLREELRILREEFEEHTGSEV